MKRRAAHLFKLVLVAALLGYASHSGILDWKALGGILRRPGGFLVFAPFLALTVILLNLRWYFINRAFGNPIPFWSLVKVTMGPSFFFSLVGGWAGGDVAKAFVVGKARPERKTAALAGIVLDRWSGIAGVLIATVVAMFFLPPDVRGRFGVALVILIIAIAAAIPLSSLFTGKFQMLQAARPPVSVLLPAVGFSLLLPLVNALGYAAVSAYLGLSLDLPSCLSIVPVSSFLTYLTMLPFGIGVEQLTLFEIAKMAGAARPEDGALLASAVQTYSLTLHLIIAISLLTSEGLRRRHVAE